MRGCGVRGAVLKKNHIFLLNETLVSSYPGSQRFSKRRATKCDKRSANTRSGEELLSLSCMSRLFTVKENLWDQGSEQHTGDNSMQNVVTF